MNAPLPNQAHTVPAALSYIPAHDRDVWVRMAMAIKSELGETGYVIWEQWSQSADNFNAKAAKAVWKGIKAGGKVTIASLFHEAMQRGYKPTTPYTTPTAEQRARLEAERLAAEAESAEIERQQREAAKAKAAKLWAAAGPGAADHAYLIAKGIKPEGAKQLRNMLVLPLRAGGELVNLQLIGSDGSKRFLTGGQVKGTALVLGALKGAESALLCEGWATGLSLREATGLPVIVAWNAGNLPTIAERVAASMPDLLLTITGDCDASQTGQQAATKAAQAHGNARWCVPSFTDQQRQQWQQQGHGEPSDFNDLHLLVGLEAVAMQIEQAGDQIPEPATAQITMPDASDEDAYIRYLAGLKPLDYGRKRKAAAEALGDVPLGILDKLVSAARKELESDQGDSKAAGGCILFDEVEPWPVPVDGAALLEDAYQLLCRYVIADRETLRAAALWAALTWFADYATVLPLAVVTAPEKGCGKSTLLNALAKLACRPLYASNITPAALFRAVEAWQPTLLIDEADTFAKDNEELRGVLNAGHTRDTATIVRVVEVGGELQPRAFSVWGPKAMAGIGHMPETIMSRAVILTMRRKLPSEKADNLRHCDHAAFLDVKRRFARWADDNGETFAGLRPVLDGLHNRTADNWEPLLALADLAGEHWPKQARHAAIKLTGSEDDAPSLNQELLGDIQSVFDRLKVDRIHTADLIEELCKDEESAWMTYNRGRPLSPRQLSKRLAEFGIKPRQIKIKFENKNGFELAQFKDVFSRYLASSTDLSSTPLQANTRAAYSDFLSSTGSLGENLSSTCKPNTGAACRGVEDRNAVFRVGDEKESENADWLADYSANESTFREVF